MEFRTLKANEIDCRIAQIDKGWLTLLLYKDARVDMDILDETVGCLNWKREHLRENANCRVSIWNPEIKEWISKEDTGTESFSEAEKGLASDSFKRACVNWGIGRELYSSPSIFVFPRKDILYRYDGREVEEFYLNKRDKYETKTRFYVDYIDYDNNREVQNLIIRDNKNNVRFTQLTEEFEKQNLEEEIKIQKINDDTRERIYKKYNIDSLEKLTISQRREILNDLSKDE